RSLMAVAVISDLVAAGDDPLAHLGVRLDGVARNEPRTRQLALGEHPHEAVGADLTELAAGDQVGRLRPPWPDPDRDGVEVESEADGDVHSHGGSLTQAARRSVEPDAPPLTGPSRMTPPVRLTKIVVPSRDEPRVHEVVFSSSSMV